MEEYTRQDIYKYIHPNTIKSNTEAYDHLYKMMVNTTLEGATASHKGRAERRDNYAFLKQVNVPALVIAGEQDFFFPIEKMREMANEIPHVQFKVVLNSGHMPNMEQPVEFNKLLVSFYDGLNTTGAKINKAP